jgi:long-chain acyl-CoA synthetase
MAEGSPGRPGDHTLGLLAEQSFERHGDYESLFFEGRWYRSGELFDRSCRIAVGLSRLGIDPGDRVVVLMSNGPEVGIVYTALWRAGAAVTPVIFLVGPDELHRILADSEASAIVTSPEFLPSVMGAAAGIASLRWVVTAGEAPPSDTEGPELIPLRQLESADPGDIVPRAGDDVAALMYTGGTTGQAKGVVLTHENLWFCGNSAYEASHVDGVTSAIVPLPLSHAFGLITTIVGLHSDEPPRGVLMRWFDPQAFLQLVQDHGVQRGALVPSMVQILLGAPLEEFDLSSLRYLNVGAAPLSVDVVREFERRVPGVEICEGYGCTESGAVVSVNRPGARRLGTVGTPIPG